MRDEYTVTLKEIEQIANADARTLKTPFEMACWVDVLNRYLYSLYSIQEWDECNGDFMRAIITVLLGLEKINEHGGVPSNTMDFYRSKLRSVRMTLELVLNTPGLPLCIDDAVKMLGYLNVAVINLLVHIPKHNKE